MGTSGFGALVFIRVTVTISAAPANKPIFCFSDRYIIIAVVTDISNNADTAYQTDRIRRGRAFPDEVFFDFVTSGAEESSTFCQPACDWHWSSGMITLLITSAAGGSPKRDAHSPVSVGER